MFHSLAKQTCDIKRRWVLERLTYSQPLGGNLRNKSNSRLPCGRRPDGRETWLELADETIQVFLLVLCNLTEDLEAKKKKSHPDSGEQIVDLFLRLMVRLALAASLTACLQNSHKQRYKKVKSPV